MAGFVAPQAAFSILADRAQAGSIAGIVLSRYAVLAIASVFVYAAAWVISWLTSRPWPRRTLLVVGLALLLIAVSQWYVTPQIAGLRAQMSSAAVTVELQNRFDSLHRMSVVLFGCQWLLSAAALILHARRGFVGVRG